MFDAVEGMQASTVICGIIWALALGLAAGNYACSLVFRLPRGRLLLDKTPYCGTCGTLLKVKDLFPVVSALLLKHRCRYCGTPFPVSHTWTELAVGLLFVLTFLKYGFGEQFILIVATGVFLITLAAIHANEGMIMARIMLAALVFGMMYRILADHTIYNFFEGGLYGLLFGAALWHKSIRREGHIYVLPKPALLLALGGVIAGALQLVNFVGLFVALFLASWLYAKARKARLMAYTAPFAVAVILSLLYP